MNKTALAGKLLLFSTALCTVQAYAQAADTTSAPLQMAAAETAEKDKPVDISAPGARNADDIIVQGRYIPDSIRATSEVISILSADEIKRTGDGDIAGALQRITGLSLVGGRFVYVRGLGERYSLALLNGSPLPSPEPLRRVVPLDLFPTSMIASSVVQKSYSANYPGEFGGGVINLTTRAVPEESFLTIGGGIGGNSETTFELGYTYYGSSTDFTGYDGGNRKIPSPLKNAMDSGNLIVEGSNFSNAQMQEITASLQNASTTLIQRNKDIPVDFSVDVSAGTSVDIGEDRLGIIATFGWDNKWRTQGGLQQTTAGLASDENGNQVINPDSNFRFLSTENRVVMNGLVGLGYEFGESKIRWTNLYIHDTSKEARILDGVDEINVGSDRLNKSYTSWYERQLFDTQVVGEFKFGDVSLDVRGTYANTKRDAPYERSFSYRFNATANDFKNDLRSPGESATVAFSELSEDVWAASADLSYDLPTSMKITATAGYAYSDTSRTSTRREFAYRPSAALDLAVAQERPDYLLSDYNIYTYNILLVDLSSASGAAKYDAGLEVNAGYLQVDIEPVDYVRANFGVRYEDATQVVTPIDLFGLGGSIQNLSTNLKNDYWLPSATITWNFAEDMQLRLAASKTIARPQFRELAPQQYFDNESDRTFIGNNYLTDSKLLNLEARYEYYMDQEDRLSVAGFFKSIDKPIEAIAIQQGQTFFTTFANAPKATLYGVELEVQKKFPLQGLLDGKLFDSRALVVSSNYTYSKSKLKVRDGDTTIPTDTAGVPIAAAALFRDGAPLTGQSDHIVNLQFGLEDEDSLSQQTLMLTYASKRVTNRFTSGGQAIDFMEEPGFRLDFVARQGFAWRGVDFELKLEARNLTNENYEEYQTFNGSRVDRNTYDLGRSFKIGLSATF